MADSTAVYKYSSVDGTTTRPTSETGTASKVLKVVGGVLLLVLAFLLGTTQDSFLLSIPSDSGDAPTLSVPNDAAIAPTECDSKSVSLPQDFKTAKLQVAVSDDGRTVLMALPAQYLNGVYRMSQWDGSDEWETTSIKDRLRSIRSLDLFENGDLTLYWADGDLYGYRKNQQFPEFGQGPFPNDVQENSDRYNYFPKIAVNEDVSRIILLALDPDMTLRVYGKQADNPHAFSNKEEAQIECTDFGYDCLREYDYDDAGSILSYKWISETTVAVDMCTIGRCSIHLFESRDNSWVPTLNFTRPPSGRVSFTMRDDQQKMVSTELKRADTDYNVTIHTWTNQDRWGTPFNQTFALENYELLDKHYLSVQGPPMVSKDGSVLCLVVVNTFDDRPIVIETLVDALIYHWDRETNEWVLHQTVALGKDVSQVELSGNGNRLVLFQKDYSFRVQDI